MPNLIIRKSSIQNKLLLSYFWLIVLIISVIGTVLYQGSKIIIEQQVGRSRRDVMEQIGRNANIIFDEIISVSNIYCFNEDLIQIVRAPLSADPFDRITDANKVMEIFSRYTYSFDNLKYDVILYGYNGRAYTSWINDRYNFESIIKQPWYKKVISQNGKIHWIGTFNDRAGYREDKYVFSAACLLKNYYTEKPLGVLLLNVNETVLYDVYKSALGMKNNIYIIDGAGRIITHSDRRSLGKHVPDQKFLKKLSRHSGIHNYMVKRNGAKVLVTSYPLAKVGWTIVEEVPLRAVLAPIQGMKLLILLLIGVGMLVGLVLSFVIARRISLPIRALHHSIQEVEKGNLAVVTQIHSRDEIGELSQSFNRMVAKIGGLMRNVQKEVRLKRQAELEFLQAQINPHFLYNTLTSIRCLISMGQGESAEKMLVSLVRLLRKSFSNDREFLTVEEEVDNLKDYLLIQRFRYPDKFGFEIDCPDAIAGYMVLKLILQPLVENAIFHGLEPKEGSGIIRIRGYLDQDDLVFQIQDDGVGMTADQIRDIWDKKDKHSDNFSKVGLVNVHERLQLNYGIRYGVTISSKSGEGTVVEIRMPIVLRGEEGEEFESFDCGR